MEGLQPPGRPRRGRADHEAADDRAGEGVGVYHGAWGRCSRGARALHGRNFEIIHGLGTGDGDRRVDAVICWTPEGRTQGGTATGMKMARAVGVPVLNMARSSAADVLETMTKIAQKTLAA